VPLDRSPDAIHFCNIYAHSNDQDVSVPRAFGSTAGSDYTGTVVAPAKTQKIKRTVPNQRGTKPRTSSWSDYNVSGIRILQVPAFARLPWLVQGFSTRPGGVTDLEGKKVLNLGFTDWDAHENVLENRRRFQSALGASDFTLASLKQIHSDIVHAFDGPPYEPLRGDASITDQTNLLLGVQTADCVPILLVDSKKRTIAAVHAGWRGALQRIVTKTIGKMRMQFGTKPSDLLAAIGPAIGGCCYEVGTEVAVQFKSQFANANDWFDELRTGDEPNPLQWLSMMPPGHQPPPKNVLLDLKKANRAQLIEAGVRAENIFTSDLCTACRRDLLFSYRKEGATTGRLMSVIGVRNSIKKSLR
jgi:YfiH family protein